MSKIGLSIKLDVTKIDKSRLFKGAKGTYLDLTTFVDLDNMDQFDNNGFISQTQSKEEVDGGADRTPILGNCKVFWKEDAQAAPKKESQHEVYKADAAPSSGSFEDDIPFAPFMKDIW